MKDVPADIQRAGSEAARMYERLIAEGYGHRWAEMCALQRPPGAKGTDRAVMQGRYAEQWLDDMPTDQARRITREAKAAGINISGKYYCSGLADKRGHCDPAAWIDSSADIKRVAVQRNLTVRGIVDHEAAPTPPPKSKPLSDRLIREMSAIERRRHPGKSKAELREIVIDKYAPRWKRK
jgi:hypothetical protein